MIWFQGIIKINTVSESYYGHAQSRSAALLSIKYAGVSSNVVTYAYSYSGDTGISVSAATSFPRRKHKVGFINYTKSYSTPD